MVQNTVIECQQIKLNMSFSAQFSALLDSTIRYKLAI